MSSQISYIRFWRPWWSIHLRQQGAAATDDADDAVAHEGQVLAQHARVNREVVHALPGLVLQGGEHGLLVELLDVAAE